MATTILLGLVCASISVSATDIFKKQEQKASNVNNEIVENYDNFDSKEFRDDQIIITFDRKTSAYIDANECFPEQVLLNDFGNLNFEKSDLIAGLNKYNNELTFTIPLVKKGRSKVIDIVNKVRKLKYVSLCEPDFIDNSAYETYDKYVSTQYSISDSFSNINVKKAWDITRGNKRVRVGVIDSGIDNHPDLKANLVDGYDFYNNNKNTLDDIVGHGTHVAGIIAAQQNSIGISGIAPLVSIVPLQTANENGKHYSSTRVKAINYATSLWGTDKQISVLNHSILGFGESEEILDAVKKFPGIFVWCAGNENTNVDKFSRITDYNYENLISVGNVDSNLDRFENLTDSSKGSNYGNSVNIYAPGTLVVSTIPVSQDPINPYKRWTGTSMSAPHVAATAALIYSKYPNLTRDEVKRAILESGKALVVYGGGNKYNTKYLDVANALASAKNIASSKYAYLRIGITYKAGNTWSVKLINDNNESVHVCYNSRMCFGSDGENFTGLKHIKEIDISANSYRIVQIDEYGTARYIAAAITYSNGNLGHRYISFVKGLSYDSNDGGKTDMVFNNYQIQRLDFSSSSSVPNYLSLSVINRTGFFSYTYTIRIRNNNSFAVFASYNKKMCFCSDAEKFTVSDERNITISSNSYADVTITSNGTAGYITSRIKYSRFGFDYSKVTYANGLSKNSIGTNKYSSLRYEIGGVYIDEV